MSRTFIVATMLLIFSLLGVLLYTAITYPKQIEKANMEAEKEQQLILKEFESIVDSDGAEVLSHSRDNDRYEIKASKRIYSVGMKEDKIYYIAIGGNIIYERTTEEDNVH